LFKATKIYSVAAIRPLRQIERRQWWLFSFGVLASLLLTIAVVSLCLLVLLKNGDSLFRANLEQAYRGLVALVLIFDIYTLYQQLQIHRIRRQLTDREELFRLINENAGDMIAVVGREGQRLYNSPAYKNFLGYSPEDLKSTPAFEQIHPEDRNRVIQAAEETHRTGVGQRLEYRMRHKDGTWRTLESTAGAIRNARGEIEQLVIVNRDISERKRAERALQNSEARYRGLVENTTRYGICEATLGGRFLDANRALVEMLGYKTKDQLLKVNLSSEIFRDPHALQGLVKECRIGEKSKDVEVEWKCEDGTPLVVRCNGRPVKDEQGELVGIEVIAEDVTERRAFEEQLRAAQKMEAIGRLAGGVAHDFNNLLGVIIGYSELLQERLKPTDPLRATVEEIRKAGRRASSLTHQLLAFSRQQVLEPRIIDLNAVVADTEKMLRRLIGEHIELVTSLAPDLRTVKADPGQIERVIINLAINARDAMPNGGRLTIETANAELDQGPDPRLPSLVPGSYVLLAMSDNGIGMDAQTQARVFEPFFTTKQRGKGTGLGLATVYGVIKQSGGYIWVYTEPGKGSTFKIYLPLLEEAVPETKLSSGPVPPFHGSETILLVEDEDSLRTLVRELLEESGYTVLDAAGGEQAILVAKQYQGAIDLLLTDMVMPGMSGQELAENLHALRPETKALYMSGYLGYSAGRHDILEPDTLLLQKPFTRNALVDKVREVLETQEARKQVQ